MESQGVRVPARKRRMQKKKLKNVFILLIICEIQSPLASSTKSINLYLSLHLKKNVLRHYTQALGKDPTGTNLQPLSAACPKAGQLCLEKRVMTEECKFPTRKAC